MAVNVSQIRLETANLSPGATPETKTRTPASSPNTSEIDWRVSLTVPDVLKNPVGPVLSPLIGSTGTRGRMIFPFTPTIIYSHTANYNTISPTHSNYPFYAYQNSQVDQVQITGDFFSENEKDARYWIACVHFLRTMTKMFYGNGDYLGNPPPLSRLNGYGKHVLNDVPVLITNFTVDLPADVDYIPCSIQEGGSDSALAAAALFGGSVSGGEFGSGPSSEINYVPVQSTMTVQVVPNYARASHSQFNLKTFANGGFVGDEKGFI